MTNQDLMTQLELFEEQMQMDTEEVQDRYAALNVDVKYELLC
jgi:hypothetical protein